MNRDEMLDRLRARTEPWDMVIIGGGATGVGTAVDAASRGYDVVLLEQSDFGKGTSSRSTKLVHGGVRYLQQGNLALVMEALKERGLLRQNAPHLVDDLAFVVPNYDWWEAPFYGLGMKVYDMLAGKYGFGRSQLLSREETLARIPTIETEGLRGGVLYHDGQFDDARLLIALARTAAAHGATLVNYCPVTGVRRDHDTFLDGVTARDTETGETFEVSARVVVNATGPFSDGVRRLVDPDAEAMIAPSQGTHLVFDRRVLPGDAAIMVPRTSDGRVLFAIPWHDRVLIGTTDTPIDESTLEPRAREDEIAFILETADEYLETNPTRADVRSVFTGIRPLVKAGDATSTAALSREHSIHIDRSGMLTIAGGKWTTYRKMAEDTVDHAITIARLDERPCVTRDLPVHGATQEPSSGHLRRYGTDADAIAALAKDDPKLGEPLHEALDAIDAEVVWAVRHEMARTVDDALARRTRSLILDARAAHAAAPRVAALMAQQLGRDQAWVDEQVEAFEGIAGGYWLG